MSRELPDAQLIVIGPKASVKRWGLNESRKETIALMKVMIDAQNSLNHKNYVFIDDSKEFLDADGKPIPELLQADGLHLSPAGYKIWNERLKPLLK
ncbi:MAG: hypothetical protein QM811_14150 [Pirellulales bacterium]